MNNSKEFKVIESKKTLESFLKSNKNLRIRTRLFFLLLVEDKRFKTQVELALYLGVCEWTLRNWKRQYIKDGIKGLLIISNGGKRREVVTKDIHEGLQVKLNNSTDPLLSYNHAVEWVKSQYNIAIKYNTLRTYMKRHFGTKLKTPINYHYKKDEEAIEVLKKLTIDPKSSFFQSK